MPGENQDRRKRWASSRWLTTPTSFLSRGRGAYRIAERLAPSDYRWVYGEAFLQEENGDEKDELRLLEQTLRLKPDHIPSQLKLADALFKLDRLDEAAHYYQMAAQAPGSSASLQANFGLGRIAARHQDWKQTIGVLRSPSLRLILICSRLWNCCNKPTTGSARRVRLRKCGRPSSRPGRKSYRRWTIPERRVDRSLLFLHPPAQTSRRVQPSGIPRPGHRHCSQGSPGGAGGRGRPQLPRPHAAQFATRQCGAIDEALTQLNECLRLRPDDPVPLWMFAQDFFDTPKTGPAVERLHTMMTPYAGRNDAHFYLGLIADARGETGEAVAQYQATLQNDPNNSGVYNKLGVLASKAGRFDEAIASLQKSVQLNPMNATARFNLGVTLLQRGKDAQGLKELSEVLRLKPDYAAAHFCMGFAFLYAKKVDEATAHFREGLRYRPEDAEAHFGLGVGAFDAAQAGRRHRGGAGSAETAPEFSRGAGVVAPAPALRRKALFAPEWRGGRCHRGSVFLKAGTTTGDGSQHLRARGRCSFPEV